MRGRPTLIEFRIAVASEMLLHCAARCAPIGSLAEQHAMREFDEARREAARIEKELGEYISALELRLSTTQSDRRR